MHTFHFEFQMFSCTPLSVKLGFRYYVALLRNIKISDGVIQTQNKCIRIKIFALRSNMFAETAKSPSHIQRDYRICLQHLSKSNFKYLRML